MTNNQSKQVAIIGGGGAGMMAAISAAQSDSKVTLFEKTESLGNKIIISGRGRCNVTNKEVSWKNFNGTHPKFTASVLARFSNKDVIEFFESRGVILKEEDRGRMFPVSNKSSDFVDVLIKEMKKLGVIIQLNFPIRTIKRTQNIFELMDAGKNIHKFDKVVIATGGRTYPKTGSTGNGYRFAQELGHTVIKPMPISVPFRIKSELCNRFMGIKVDSVLKIYEDDKQILTERGLVLFTHLGISGPVVLRSSRAVSNILSENPKANLRCVLNIIPEFSPEEIGVEIQKRIEEFPERKLTNLFHEILPKKVPKTIFDAYEIEHNKELKYVGKKEINNIIEIFRNFELGTIELLDWHTAQFTAGGVDVKEINSSTMESKIVPGLYFAGEVVDIDGQSGGYNLTFAWSSGWVAGSIK